MTRRLHRPDGALLAGVAAGIANRLGWNVWAIRALLVVGLLVEPLAVGGAYLVVAVVMSLCTRGAVGTESEKARGLDSEHLRARGRRIAELEERFRKLEREGR